MASGANDFLGKVLSSSSFTAIVAIAPLRQLERLPQLILLPDPPRTLRTLLLALQSLRLPEPIGKLARAHTIFLRQRVRGKISLGAFGRHGRFL